MAYERLIKQGRIQPYNAKPIEVNLLLEVANRDLITAQKNQEEAPDWAYSIAYNAILQASRALMLHTGFRPRGADQHASVVFFVEERLGTAYKKQTSFFDQMRRKRHRVIYEIAGLVSKAEAEQTIAFAREYINIITEEISG